MRRNGAGDFDGVLDRLGEQARVTRFDDRRVAILQRGKDRRNTTGRIRHHRLAAKTAKCRFETGARHRPHIGTKMGTHIVRQFFRRGEQIDTGIGMDNRKRQRHRRAGHVAPTDIEQPGNRIKRRDHHRIGTACLQNRSDRSALGRRCLAGMVIEMNLEPCQAWHRAAGPDPIDRVGGHRDQCSAFGGEQLAGRFDPAARVQPGIIADAIAGGSVIGKPLRRAGLRHILIIEDIARHLLAHLDGVAAIGEDRRLVANQRRRPRRTAKAGQPFEPLGIAADIFTHMLVGERHDKTAQAIAGQLGVQRGKPVLDGGHIRYSF